MRLVGGALLALVVTSPFPQSAWNAWTKSHGQAAIPSSGLTNIARAWWHHDRGRCGAPVARPVTSHGVTTQHFERCTLVETHTVSVLAQPGPTATLPPVVNTSTAIPTWTPLPVLPTATPFSITIDCALPSCVVALLNSIRQYYGVSPLTLDQAMSNGTATCIGALGHSQHMAAEGFISHDDFPNDLCGVYSAGGENVGMTNVGTQAQNIAWMTQQMMNEPHDPATCAATSDHACTIINPRFTRVGIGVYQTSAMWLTETFEG